MLKAKFRGTFASGCCNSNEKIHRFSCAVVRALLRQTTFRCLLQSVWFLHIYDHLSSHPAMHGAVLNLGVRKANSNNVTENGQGLLRGFGEGSMLTLGLL